jgi:capsular polysaccharide export protein
LKRRFSPEEPTEERGLASKRSFLFLQGVCSPFFAQLADRLAAGGHRVMRVNFNCGDTVNWLPRDALRYRGKMSEMRPFLDKVYQRYGITDQILFGDRRPVHRPAVDHGEAAGVRTHVFEEGYFRPYWVTLEREGVNGHSLLPRDPDWFWTVGADLPDYGDGEAFSSSFAGRAVHDVFYHSFGFWNPLVFPRYQPHTPVNAAVEYLGYARRLPLLRYYRQRDNALIVDLLARNTPFYLLPLQLNSDAQIRDHSRFDNMEGVIDYVMDSFAMHARPDARLVIKNHPLDMALVNYPKMIRRLSGKHGLEGRVDFLETGDLAALVRHAKGTVTVNSTVGSYALGLACPVVCLSDPIYNLPGLTYQAGLDAFWGGATPPDGELFRRFRNTVIHTTQINGGFYSRKGIDLAVKNSARVLEAWQSPLERLLAEGRPSPESDA